MYIFNCFGAKIATIFMATEVPTVTVVEFIATNLMCG